MASIAITMMILGTTAAAATCTHHNRFNGVNILLSMFPIMPYSVNRVTTETHHLIPIPPDIIDVFRSTDRFNLVYDRTNITIPYGSEPKGLATFLFGAFKIRG